MNQSLRVLVNAHETLPLSYTTFRQGAQLCAGRPSDLETHNEDLWCNLHKIKVW